MRGELGRVELDVPNLSCPHRLNPMSWIPAPMDIVSTLKIPSLRQNKWFLKEVVDEWNHGL